MSAKIRLSRVGTRSKPFYRVVVIDESSARNGRPIEVIGHYDPRKEPSIFEVNKEKMESWLKKGATPTDVIRRYLGKTGILSPLNFDKKKKKLPKGEQPVAAVTAAAAEAAATTATEATAPPVEENK